MTGDAERSADEDTAIVSDIRNIEYKMTAEDTGHRSAEDNSAADVVALDVMPTSPDASTSTDHNVAPAPYQVFDQHEEIEHDFLTSSPMLQRYPSTFVPLRRHATSIAEVAFLVPSSNSSLRKATATAATFNMTATIIGGGVLSIPLSCSRAGIVPFTILMIISSIMSAFSLEILCSCARRTASTSYGTVARRSFGSRLELFSTSIIFAVLVFTVTGLMVLNQGIWSPIAVALWSKVQGREQQEETTGLQDAVVLLAAVAMLYPYLLKRDLTSLRHICYVGFFSIAVLCVAMAYRAVEGAISDPQEFLGKIKWSATTMSDVLSALPIIMQAFLCSFNMISVHCALVEPTRRRVKAVINRSVFLAFLLMYVFGLFGYLCPTSFDDTNGNILLNFNPSDNVILLGRIGCGITTLFALPMNSLPCREACLSMIAQLSEVKARRKLAKRRKRLESQGGGDEEQGRLISPSRRLSIGQPGENEVIGLYTAVKDYAACSAVPPQKDAAVPTAQQQGEQLQLPTISKKEQVIHSMSTAAIIFVCYVAAVLAPGVAIVWDISGSTMTFLIQFILPAACYIRLKTKHLKSSAGGRMKMTKNLLRTWILLVVSCLASLLCTAITIRRLLSS